MTALVWGAMNVANEQKKSRDREKREQAEKDRRREAEANLTPRERSDRDALIARKEADRKCTHSTHHASAGCSPAK